MLNDRKENRTIELKIVLLLLICSFFFAQLTYARSIVDASISKVEDRSSSLDVHNTDKEDVKVDSLTEQYLNLNSGKTKEEKSLEDVVVVAYGRSRKRDLTGAISSITSRDIEGLPATNLISALEGASGVMIQDNNGQVGHQGFVFIRGFASANGTNEPLFVVDGAEFYGSLNDINPEDIESISVLKDAAALALYGARAGNGVIMISLKTGRRAKIFDGEKGDIRVNIKQGIYTRGMSDYERIGANDWMYWQYQGLMNSNLTNGMSNQDAIRNARQNLIRSYIGYNAYDTAPDKVLLDNGRIASNVNLKSQYKDDRNWEKALLQTGYRQEYDISGSHITQRANSYMSMGYLNETGYVKKTSFHRMTGRVHFTYRPIEKIEISLGTDLSYQRSNVMRQTQDNPSNIISFMRNVAPIYPIHLHDELSGDFVLNKTGDKQYDASDDRPFMAKRNPVWELEELQDKYTRITIFSRPSLTYHLPYGFVANTFASYGFFTQKDVNTYGTKVGEWKGIGMTRHSEDVSMTRLWNQNLKWKRKYGDHEISAMIAHENQQLTYNLEDVSANKQLAEGNDDFINYAGVHNLDGYSTTLRTESYMSRILCNFKNRYFAEINYRRDGSSKFSAKGRWGNFYALGLSYVMSEEDWFQTNRLAETITEAKFRLNGGQVGNDRSADLSAYRTLYGLTSISSTSATYRTQIGNPDLKWESIGTANLGFDIKLWNRWQVTCDAYIKESFDLIFDAPLSLSTGLMTPEITAASPTYTTNLGKVRSIGFEFQTDADVYRSGESRLNLGLTVTHAYSRVTSMPEAAKKNGIIRSNGQIIAMNEPLYTWYLPEYVGVNTQNGRALYSVDTDHYTITGESYIATYEENDKIKVDASNDPDLVCINGVWYSQNLDKGYTRRVKCGSVLPYFYGSMSARYSWKGLTLGMTMNFSVGGKVLDASYMNLMSASGSTMNALHKDIQNSWVAEKYRTVSEPTLSKSIQPAVNYSLNSANNGRSTRFLTNASYLTLRRLRVSYQVPDFRVKRWGIRQLSINLTGENIFMLTARRGMDPNQGYSATGLSGVIGDTSSTLRLFSLGLSFKI